MAQEGGFSLISVTSDDEDDIVIQAGVRDAQPGSGDDVSTDPDGGRDASEAMPEEGDKPQEDDDVAAEPEDGEGLDGEEAPDEEVPSSPEGDSPADEVVLGAEALRVKQRLDEAGLTVEDLDEEGRAEYERHLARSRARAQAEQMLTTEEDLHTKMPFSGMQRAIVVVLLVLVAAFVIYWTIGR